MEADDPRLEYLSEIILKTFKLKPDKWAKLLGNDEHKQVIAEFFEKADNHKLIIQLTNSGALIPSYDFPVGGGKHKSVYFVKKEKKDPITKDKYRGSLLFGDLSYAPLDQLSALVDELLVPLLSNKNNHQTWPVVVSQDVLRHVHQLKNNVFVISGQVKGRTLLPLPVGSETINPDEAGRVAGVDSYERNLVHSIESAIIDWAHQINKALKHSSAQPLLEGANPTPLVEIDFWSARAVNLENIFDQLRDTKVQKMAEILMLTDSSYYPAFKKMYKDAVCALDEARDINMHLKPLRKHMEDIEQTEIPDLHLLLPPMMHCIALLWTNSKHYCKH